MRLHHAGRAVTLASFLIFAGCSAPRSVVAEARPAASDVPYSREANDAARFLAGLPGAPGSPFAALEQTDAWKDHQRRLDAAWHNAEKEMLPGMRTFQAQELNAAAFTSRKVFYPFSGPDSLTMTTYFPHNSTYVMVALEPSGTLPTARQIEKRKDLAGYLAAIRDTVASELGRSFFVTREMDREFRGQVTDGLLSPILQLLVRTGHTILGFRYVRLDENGQVIDRAADYHAPTRYGNKGFEVEFQTDADSSLHTLYYFSVNLANDRLAENKPFQIYLAQLTDTVSMLKATSYMPHHKEFSMIRDALLANSAAIVQDDSGIPYRMFMPETWNVQLYGEYTKPYGSFSWLEQPDLRQAFHAAGVRPLPMRVGYGYHRINSNIEVAIKKIVQTP